MFLTGKRPNENIEILKRGKMSSLPAESGNKQSAQTTEADQEIIVLDATEDAGSNSQNPSVGAASKPTNPTEGKKNQPKKVISPKPLGADNQQVIRFTLKGTGAQAAADSNKEICLRLPPTTPGKAGDQIFRVTLDQSGAPKGVKILRKVDNLSMASRLKAAPLESLCTPSSVQVIAVPTESVVTRKENAGVPVNVTQSAKTPTKRPTSSAPKSTNGSAAKKKKSPATTPSAVVVTATPTPPATSHVIEVGSSSPYVAAGKVANKRIPPPRIVTTPSSSNTPKVIEIGSSLNRKDSLGVPATATCTLVPRSIIAPSTTCEVVRVAPTPPASITAPNVIDPKIVRLPDSSWHWMPASATTDPAQRSVSRCLQFEGEEVVKMIRLDGSRIRYFIRGKEVSATTILLSTHVTNQADLQSAINNFHRCKICTGCLEPEFLLVQANVMKTGYREMNGWRANHCQLIAPRTKCNPCSHLYEVLKSKVSSLTKAEEKEKKNRLEKKKLHRNIKRKELTIKVLHLIYNCSLFI